jgi:hypothetical protein
MASVEQVRTVAETCSKFNSDGLVSSMDMLEVSCFNCENWDGEKCTKNLFNKGLNSLDQT